MGADVGGSVTIRSWDGMVLIKTSRMCCSGTADPDGRCRAAPKLSVVGARGRHPEVHLLTFAGNFAAVVILDKTEI